MSIPYIFISHDTDNRDFVEQEILELIERFGLSSWYAPRDIPAATKWESAIRQGLEISEWFLVVVSKESIGSIYVTAEVQWAVTHRWGRMAIVLKDDADPSQLHIAFGQLQYIDYHKDLGSARQKLEYWLRSIITDSSPRMIVNVVGARGGVGKSTITCRMAELVAESGNNSLIIDLDTSTGGSTSLQRERGYRGRSSSTYSLLEGLVKNSDAHPNPITLLEVTPNYLKERDQYGRVFLLPAAPLENVSRPPTIRLIQEIINNARRDQPEDVQADDDDDLLTPVQQAEKILSRKTLTDEDVIAKVMSVILSASDYAPVPIHCIFIDCGAEGPEFNTLIDASHHISNITYIIVQPDSSSRGNLSRVGNLLTRGANSQTAHKLRVIINRVASLDQEEQVRGQFADYLISGVIPYDQLLFEDVQRGRVQHFYRYDSITRAIHAILERDFPVTLIPKEADLWVRSVVEKLQQHSPATYLKDFLNQQSLVKWGVGFLLGLIGVILSGIQVLSVVINLSNQTSSEIPRLQQIMYIIALILFGVLLFIAARKLRYIWERVQLLSALADLQETLNPLQEMENFLLEMCRSDSKLVLLNWLRATVTSTPKRQHSLTLWSLIRQIFKA